MEAEQQAARLTLDRDVADQLPEAVRVGFEDEGLVEPSLAREQDAAARGRRGAQVVEPEPCAEPLLGARERGELDDRVERPCKDCEPRSLVACCRYVCLTTSTTRCFISGWSLWALTSPIGQSTFSSGM